MKIDIRTCTRCGEIVYNSTVERPLIMMHEDDGHGNIVCQSCEMRSDHRFLWVWETRNRNRND